MQAKIPRPLFIAFLILVNAIPVYGVFYWGWKSFDLIFLYWLENLVIGLFMIMRMLIRPYSHGVELAMPVFGIPFFTVHYGLFCFVHGQLIVNLFGKGLQPDLVGISLPALIMPLIESHYLFWPFMGLFAYQLIDWVRDIGQRGLGSDGLKDLTMAPYRRIAVLHVTILGAGFAMTTLNDPVVGLILLIVFKTGMDLYNWNKDEHRAVKTDKPVINEKVKQKVDAFLDDPKIMINGKEIHFKNIEELKASSQYRLMKGVMRMLGGNQQLEAVEAYMAQRENERSIEKSDS